MKPEEPQQVITPRLGAVPGTSPESRPTTTTPLSADPTSQNEAEALEAEQVLSEEPINDDGRELGKWESRYPEVALKKIRTDAIVVSVAFCISLIGTVMTWRGDVLQLASYNCYQCNVGSLNQYSYVFFAGLLGGSLYGIKYLYKVVARGYWNIDRRLWRLFSPPLAAGLALGTGAFVQAGVFGFSLGESTSGASYFALGFITGYFADRAIGKMQEIAETVFGDPHRQHHHPKPK